MRRNGAPAATATAAGLRPAAVARLLQLSGGSAGGSRGRAALWRHSPEAGSTSMTPCTWHIRIRCASSEFECARSTSGFNRRSRWRDEIVLQSQQ